MFACTQQLTEHCVNKAGVKRELLDTGAWSQKKQKNTSKSDTKITDMLRRTGASEKSVESVLGNAGQSIVGRICAKGRSIRLF